MESYDKELLNQLGKIEKEHMPQFLSAKFYNEWFLNKFNHLFEPYRVCRRLSILRECSDDQIKIYP